MEVNISREIFDHKNEENLIFKEKEGINEEVVRNISSYKKEPSWMLNKRLDALKKFNDMILPTWGPDISKLNLNEITYFAIPDAKHDSKSWDEVPEDIKNTFEKLGIPKAEREALAGVGSQYESMTVYHNLKKEWEDKGVIFEDMDVALKKYPELLKEYFMTKCVSASLHKFSALHAAVWSGGTFIYIPKGVNVEIPLQAYFRMNAKNMGQFEHTLIVVDEDAEVHYIEGCSAPLHTTNSLHAGCVEIYVKKNARMRYSSVENWSKNTYNLNTKRAVVEENGIIEWVSGNMGSGCTMLYPCSVLKGKNSKANHVSIAFAGPGQNQDVGAKIYHLNENTSSVVKSKSISKNGGITSYRGLIKINKNCKNSKSHVECDALLIGENSKSDTIPYIETNEDDVDIGHEATTGKVSKEQLFYLMSRGLSEEEALQLIVSGFIEPITKSLPLEYAVELNRLVELEMEGGVG